MAEREETIENLQRQTGDGGHEIDRLKDELNLYKGRCQNLLRDIDMHSNAVHKMSTDSGAMGEQMMLYKERISQLEADLSKASTDRTDFAYEVKRLQAERDRLSD